MPSQLTAESPTQTSKLREPERGAETVAGFSRRAFAGKLLAAGAGALAVSRTAHAAKPPERPGAAHLQLSLAAYSFRQYFKDTSHDREADIPEAKRIDLFQFLDFCAANRCNGAELTSYYFPKEVTREFLLRLKRHAFIRGVALSGTAVGNTFTLAPGKALDEEIAGVKQWIDHATVLGMPHIRVFAGNAGKLTAEEAQKYCVTALVECCKYAGERGVTLGIENHGGIVAEPDALLAIVRAVDSPWIGINLDTGNFHTADPYADLAKCAPYAVNVQFKSEIRRRDAKAEATDVPRVIRILKEANYMGYVALEYEAKPDPFEAVPGILKQLRELIEA